MAFATWLAHDEVSLSAATREDILRYQGVRIQESRKSRSEARLLSSLRRFYRYLCREEIRESDPTTQIESPRLGRPLPEGLSEQEVEALLEQPDIEQCLGLRDRTMLEVLYATGLRVSELVTLTI